MNRTFASRTGQLWKYRVWVLLFVATVIASLVEASLWHGNPLGLPMGVTTIVYFAVALPWMVWSAAAIRCPECGTRVDWYLWSHVQRTDEDEARERLPRGPGCPACGFTPSALAPGSTAAPTPALPPQASARAGGLRRLRLWGGCFAFLLFLQGWAVFTFRGLWPESTIGRVVFLMVAPVAFVALWALSELFAERIDRASLRVSRDDFSFERILFAVVVLAVLLALLLWVETLIGRGDSF